ncbi:uncharacterized protein LOC132311617 [Cornus florida]|uniref:uncharacterized protein LOC132311617 n=1 Tax=Cornus florida TaxID=4283 RepID=UPI0028A11279|nr:uncharacterized protein LOC132311617 [Cornus florida]XP_059665599.1 uncharacterized protein LOC132311617 [Cornus florida]
MMSRRLPALNPATFCRILGGGGGGFLSSVRLLSEFCPRPPPQAATATATTTVDEEKFGSLLSSPLMIVPPFSKTEEEYDDDYNDYFHFFRVADQKKYRVRKNLGLAWQREYLTPDNAACIGSTHGWLVFLDPRNGYLYLLNPFIKHQNFSSLHNHNHLPYIPLPSLETLPTVKGMRVLKSDNLSPSTSLVRDFLMTFFDQTNEHKSPPSETVALRTIHDVVLSSSPSSSPDNDQCTTTTTAVMNYGGDLYFCKLGVDERWTLLSNDISYNRCCDVIYFSKDGRFYSSGNHHEYHQLEAWDLTDHSCPKHQLIDPTFSNPRTIPDIPKTWHDSFVKYLVESSGDLLLVFRIFNTEFVPGGKEKDPIDPPKFHRTLRFVVHKLNFKLNKWEHVKCLDDRSLFVGYNHSFSLSTRDYPELRGNSIYFTENYEELLLMCNTGHDNGVFHLDDNSINYYRTRDWKCTEPHYLLVPSPVWICDAQNNVR